MVSKHRPTEHASKVQLISFERSVNGVGRRVSHSFGYGLMDAYQMVRLARVWETVPEQQRCEIYSPHLDK
jgi:furin